MKALIKAHLLHPSVVLPIAALTELMVERDFNLSQVGLIVAARGAQAMVSCSRSLLCCHRCGAES
ncbi:MULTISPECIES: hypothetical protein [Burkholderia]|uniref:Uncharacterized protein n=1 Tax=Burkholderia paludis TaxID=1506587 RepID=A0A6J5DSM2_9BURK|nr:MULTISPECIES: hypothetical protein [Burkholderia]CAB3756607.1 hypothetical protein LMG30113_02721 [Burkholderia paludis]VWB62904.1 hypothetical protein BPA30113_02797 [Burkholderia paludis]